MRETLPDNRQDMFGREGDIEILCARALDCGITFVTGRPQMGKTWVLQELGRSLAYDEKRSSSGQSKYLVGYHECLEGEDQLLRVVSDLYTRWLSEADYAQQARQLCQSSQGQRTGIVARALGELFEKLDTKQLVGPDLGGLVKGMLNGLVAANEHLKTGGLQTPKLSYEVARDLVAQLVGLARQRVVLILDGWDQSRDIEHERRLLDSVIKHAGDWPEVHFFVGMRHPEINEASRDTPAYDAACRLRDSSATATFHELKPLADLAASEQMRLLTTVRALLPSGARVGDAELLGLLEGYPGVLARWRDGKSKLSQAPDVLQALKGYAADAQSYRYREFDVLLPQLQGDTRRLAIRLALVPRLDESSWKVLQPILNDGLHPDIWRQLVRDGVLDRATRNFPSYGHDTRYRAIRKKLSNHETLGADVLAEADALLLRCGGQIRNIDPIVVPFVAVIVAIAGVVSRPDMSAAAKLTVLAVDSLLDQPTEVALFHGAPAVATEHSALAPLLSIGLVNVMTAAGKAGQPEDRGRLLDELRRLHCACPADVAVLEPLAKGLFNEMYYAKQEGRLSLRDALLQEIRQLQLLYTDNFVVREQLACALFNTLNDSRQENRLGANDALINGLRRLHAAYPSDSAVRDQLARGLFNAMVAAKQDGRVTERDALLDELRRLYLAYPSDAAVRERLAQGLFNVMNDATHDSRLASRDALLGELRHLYLAYPDDAAVREDFAAGLFNTMYYAKREKRVGVRGILLQELRQLHSVYPADVAVRERFVTGAAFLGDEYANDGEFPKAEELLRESLRLFVGSVIDPSSATAHLLAKVTSSYFRVCVRGEIEPQSWVYDLARTPPMFP